MDLSLLLTGVAIGLAVTAPLGPVNLLVFRSAIRQGFAVAFLVGLGAVAGDLLYAAAAAYGVSWVSHLVEVLSVPVDCFDPVALWRYEAATAASRFLDGLGHR